jgi:plastocyanin
VPLGYGSRVGSTTVIGSLNAFHICGGLLAVWAIVVTALGLMSESFPKTTSQARLVGALSVLLALGAIGSGIAVGVLEEEEEGTEAAAEPAAESTPEANNETVPPPDEDTAPAGGGSKLALTADPSGQLKFDKSALAAKAGPVTIDMTNDSPVPHDVAIKGGGVNEKGKVVDGGATSTAAATLKPGKYTFYCSVPGHEQAGMEGTLTVK